MILLNPDWQLGGHKREKDFTFLNNNIVEVAGIEHTSKIIKYISHK